jgi:hypothetical protein
VTLGATAIFTLGLTAAAAHATTPSRVPASISQGSSGQLVANAVAERLQSAVSVDRLPGFAGVEVNPSPANPGVTIYWHGRVPSLLHGLAAAAGTARATGIMAGVTVRFQPAPFTQAQLLSLDNKIGDSRDFDKAGISSMGFFPQATGFWINVNTEADLAKARALVGHQLIPVHYAVSPGAALTLPLSAPAAVTPKHPGRYKDTAPFWGGDFLQGLFAGKTYGCSSGFGMHNAGKKQAAPWFMLTAAHCMVLAQQASQRLWIAGNHKNVGVTHFFSPDDDAVSLYMDSPYGVAGAGGGSYIYTGATSRANSNGQKATPVLGAKAVVAGDLVSTSGAYSGQRNSIKVQTVTWTWNAATIDGIGYQTVGALAFQVNHLNSAGHGDSGGPVFIAVKGGVEAVGLVSATRSTKDKAACTGVDLGRGCYWSLEFPLMTGSKMSIETLMKLSVNTTS